MCVCVCVCVCVCLSVCLSVCLCVSVSVSVSAPVALAILPLVLGASVRSCSSLTELWFTSTYFMNTLVNYFSLVMY